MDNSASDLRQTIANTINKILTDMGRDELTPTDSDALTGELGLDSMDLAVLVVTLKKSLGVDPFRDGSTTARTFGELVAVYEQATK